MKRIQRKRTKGFKTPENTIYVGRPTKWGNPFIDISDIVYVDASHRRTILSKWVYYGTVSETGGAAKLYRDMIMDLNSHEVETEIYNKFKLIRDTHRDLEGKNLSCFCSTSIPCHADTLLELLNE